VNGHSETQYGQQVDASSHEMGGGVMEAIPEGSYIDNCRSHSIPLIVSGVKTKTPGKHCSAVRKDNSTHSWIYIRIASPYRSFMISSNRTIGVHSQSSIG
jgi:hypothetical protein